MTGLQETLSTEGDVGSNGNKAKSMLARIQAASDIAESIPILVKELKELWDCEAITLFALDRDNRQLFSRNKIIDSQPEVRVDISTSSLAGYVAAVGKAVNIPDAYAAEDLAQFHPKLSQGSTLDSVLSIRTRSLMVLPIPHNKKLVGVMEVIHRKNGEPFSEKDFKLARELSPALGQILASLEKQFGMNPIPIEAPVAPEEGLHRISQAIHSAKNIDEILIELKDSILKLFESQAMTMYAVDHQRNEIYSKVKSGDQINEIRLPISPVSIAGWVAMEQKSVNISDVYKEEELIRYHPDLRFDSSWDKKSGNITKSVLGYPMIHSGKLMGVVQVVNKLNGEKFTEQDEKSASIIAETLALAFHNQEKYIQPKPTKFSYLIQNGIITDEELTKATAKARKGQMDLESVLMIDLKMQRKDLGKSLEIFYQLPYFGYSDTVILPSEILTGLNRSFLTKNFWIPIQKDENKVTILINDPHNPDKNQNIKQIFPKKEIEYKIGLKVDIIDFLNSSLGVEASPGGDEPFAEEMSSLLSALKNEQGELDVDSSDQDDGANAISETDSTIVRLVNKILIDAYEQGVSDIHIEPGIGKDSVMVRYRKDGTCTIYEEIPSIYKQAMISRIKIMSKLDIAERRMPQDGKIKMKYGRKEIEYRVATCPTVGGNEDAVLRILAASKPIPLEGMNFNDHNLKLIQASAAKPYGLILVVGPTGSGKTTTLHSILGYINKPDKKIWTAEDPVEITQKGLRQVQMLNKIGLDFARAMRSFLRGDPDVIMVGEMRDAETCGIGLEASLTGHLVFSTLHTNSAPETITRLLDMGMNPLNFADALLLIVAQRLVRTLCKKCKEDYHPSREEFDSLVKEYGEKDFGKLSIEYTNDLMLKKPVGCASCGDTGYAGRTGLHECLEGTDKMKRMIMQKSLVEELREQALGDGMSTLKQDGIYKIFKGDCDLKQVMAVCIV